MKLINSKNIAAALIAGLLVLATVENHAGETDINLDEAIRAQVFQELENNVRRLYESSRLLVLIKKNEDLSGQTARTGFSIVTRKPDVITTLPGQVGVFN